MAQARKRKEDMAIDERINQAEKKLLILFEHLDSDKKKFISDPIRQLAVMQVLLERLEEEIAKGDVLQPFEQGRQSFIRENPAIKPYNTTIKSYTTLFKTLLELLPKQEAAEAGQALMMFATSHPAK